MLGTRERSLPDCRPLLADPDDLTLVFQPIVDLAAATVAGYAARSRFPGTAGPDVWFAAAAEAGVAAELEALAVAKALDTVPHLPADTFLTVTVSAHLLGTGPVQDALARRPDLRHVVVELTEHAPVDDRSEVRRETERLRERGALLALGDVDSGYSGLRQMAALRPQIVTLDHAPAADAGADADPVRIAVAEMVGEFAGTIDARLLAKGLETAAGLAAVARLGVPLGRGWLLGRPSPDFAPLTPAAADLVRAQVARTRLTDSVARLLRPIRQVDPDEDGPEIPPAVVVGSLGEPRELLLADPRTGEVYRTPLSLRVRPSADVTETLQRALTRPPAHRFEPVICTDPTGQVLGLIRVEDLAAAAHGR